MTVKGIGAKKRQQYGRAVLTIIKQYCEKNAMDLDVGIETAPTQPKSITRRLDAKEKAFELFTHKRPIQEVAATINRAESTTTQYLIDYIRAKGVSDSSPWVEKPMNRKIKHAIQEIGCKQKNLIFRHLKGKASYPDINITLACLKNL
jgi:hypothetical protein